MVISIVLLGSFQRHTFNRITVSDARSGAMQHGYVPLDLSVEGVQEQLASLNGRMVNGTCSQYQKPCTRPRGRMICTQEFLNEFTSLPHWTLRENDKECSSRLKIGAWEFFSDIDFFVFMIFFRHFDVPGLVVEFGASDGISASNSLFFERFRGWHSLLLEPTECYKVVRNNRPKAVVIHSGVCEQEREMNLEGAAVWCGPSRLGQTKHVQGFAGKEVVKCQPLKNILLDYGMITLVDFLSVDTEGLEMEALRSINFNVVNVKVIVAEWRQQDGSERRDYLAKFGYSSTMLPAGGDELFWRPDLF